MWSSGLGITFFSLSHTVEHLTKLLDTTGLRLAWMPKFTSKLHYLSDEPTFKNEKKACIVGPQSLLASD